MQIAATDTALLDWTGGLLAVGIFEGETELSVYSWVTLGSLFY